MLIQARGKSIKTGEWCYGYAFEQPVMAGIGEPPKPLTWIISKDPTWVADWNMPFNMVQTLVDPDTIGYDTGATINGSKLFGGDYVIATMNGKTAFGAVSIRRKFGVLGCGCTVDMQQEMSFLDFVKHSHDIHIIGNRHDHGDMLKLDHKTFKTAVELIGKGQKTLTESHLAKLTETVIEMVPSNQSLLLHSILEVVGALNSGKATDEVKKLLLSKGYSKKVLTTAIAHISKLCDRGEEFAEQF